MLKNGIPSEDTFLRIFRLLDPKSFEAAFSPLGQRRRRQRPCAARWPLMEKRFAGRQRAARAPSTWSAPLPPNWALALGQEKVAAKSNEITAIPELLDALYLEGLLVSIDAMGCQKRIAEKITAKGGDYLLMVKGNQPSLLTAIETAFISSHETGGADRNDHAEKSHGRIVGQIAAVLPSKGIVRSGRVAPVQNDRTNRFSACYRWPGNRIWSGAISSVRAT